VLEWTANGRLFYVSIVYNMARQFRKTRRNAKARRGTRKGGKRKIVKRQRGMRKKRGTRRMIRGGDKYSVGDRIRYRLHSTEKYYEGQVKYVHDDGEMIGIILNVKGNITPMDGVHITDERLSTSDSNKFDIWKDIKNNGVLNCTLPMKKS